MIFYPHLLAPCLDFLRTLGSGPRAAAALRALAEGDAVAADAAIDGITEGGFAAAAAALSAYLRRDAGATLAHIERASLRLPQNATLTMLGAACHLGSGDFDAAIREFRVALALDPCLHVAHTLLWLAIDGAGCLGAASAALKAELLRIDREFPAPGPASHRVRVEETTLCIADCAQPALALRALRLSLAGCEFDAVKLFTDADIGHPGIDTVSIAPIRGFAAYSQFIARELIAHVRTEYALVVQWDGYVINPAAWTPEFLLYDYIGARWDNPIGRKRPHHNVGNGGFSLRSRTLLEALQDAAIADINPEDKAIGRTYRDYLEDRHGIVFAPDDVADRFAFEHHAPAGMPFGFHSISNLARIVDRPGWATLDFAFEDLRRE